ncbi:hypothetical protein BJD16_06310 [Aeromonas sobria]|uniref:Uncharacterized protein n=1 Tax=Aeromonas sobria TaxID=646 RepID=A0A1S2CL77_AERSO|nr:hypothetical protein BJD16_06310 [Aeromonas sobria]
MKQCQNRLAQYLICRRDGDNAMAAELAESICAFWQARGDQTEHTKWQKVYQDHRNHLTGEAHGQGRRRISFMPIRWLRSITD